MKVAISNFKRIEKAEVEVVGLTLLIGQSSSGKSTLLKSLRAVLANQTTDRQYRYGTNGFEVSLELEGHKLTYSRVKGDRKAIYVSPEGVSEDAKKLDRDSMAEVFPQFPLKQLKVKGAAFFPNIVSQGQLPLFSQIEPTDMFALLYEDVSKVTGRLDRLKKELTTSNKALAEVEAQVKFTEKTELEISAELALIDVEALKQYSPLLDQYTADSQTLGNLRVEYGQMVARLQTFVDVDYLQKNAPEVLDNQARFQTFLRVEPLVAQHYTAAVRAQNLEATAQALTQGLPEENDVSVVYTRLGQAGRALIGLEQAQQYLKDIPAEDAFQELPEDLVQGAAGVLARLRNATPVLARLNLLRLDGADAVAKIHALAGVEDVLARVGLVVTYHQALASVEAAEEALGGVLSEITSVLSELSSFDSCPLCGTETDLKKVFHGHQ